MRPESDDDILSNSSRYRYSRAIAPPKMCLWENLVNVDEAGSCLGGRSIGDKRGDRWRYLAIRRECCRPFGLRGEDRRSSHTETEGRSLLVRSDMALRKRHRCRIAEGKCPRDRRTAGLEAADGEASLVYSFEFDC